MQTFASSAGAKPTNEAMYFSCVYCFVLGSIFWVIGVVWDLGLAWAAGSIGAWLHNRPRVQAAKPRVEGGTYLALAGWAAIGGD